VSADAADANLRAIAARFADAAAQAIREALSRSTERFVAEHAGQVQSLDDETLDAFRSAVDGAIALAAVEIPAQLRDVGMWTSPRVRLREETDYEETSVFERLLGGLGLRGERPTDRPAEQLDDPNNRAWIALLNAADRLDPVMYEFGFSSPPDGGPDPGGGHFGLQPPTVAELDQHGHLRAIWRDYLRAFDTYHKRMQAARAEQASSNQKAILARWRRGR
jgi:hypothetical protein